MYSRSSANPAIMPGCRSASSTARRFTALAIGFSAVVVVLLASANAFAQAPGSSSQMTQEQHACAVVMGLHQPGDLYDTCIRSLNKSLSELDQARLASKDRSQCAQQGFSPGTSAFAVCVVNAE